VIKVQSKNRTTLIIDPQIIKIIKQIAINKNTTQTKVINDYLKQGIEQEPPENKSKIRFIVKPNPNKNIDDLIGSIKVSEEFDPVKAVKEVRLRKG
jgi:hypothetical protein